MGASTTKYWIPIGFIAAWLALWLIVVVALAAAGSNGGTDTSSVAPSATAPPVGVPAPAQALVPAAASATLLHVTGNGTETTARFTAKSDWQIKYNYDCAGSAFGMDGNFIATPLGKDGNPSFSNSGVNKYGPGGSGVAHEYHGGTYALDITSECDWTIDVIQ